MARLDNGSMPLQQHGQYLEKLTEKYRIERDAYWQDLFEANRYAAWLAGERQSLMDKLATNPHQKEIEKLRDQLEQQSSYIAYLENMITDKEDQRFNLETILGNT